MRYALPTLAILACSLFLGCRTTPPREDTSIWQDSTSVMRDAAQAPLRLASAVQEQHTARVEKWKRQREAAQIRKTLQGFYKLNPDAEQSLATAEEEQSQLTHEQHDDLSDEQRMWQTLIDLERIKAEEKER